MRCPYPTEIYFRHLRESPEAHPLVRYPTRCSLSVCHLMRLMRAYTHRPRASLRFWHSSLFGAATNWKLPSRARAVAVRLRLIDFFDMRALTAAHGRSALPFSDETHDRDRENRDARGALKRLGRKNEQIEAKKLRFPRSPDLAARQCCVTHRKCDRGECCR